MHTGTQTKCAQGGEDRSAAPFRQSRSVVRVGIRRDVLLTPFHRWRCVTPPRVHGHGPETHRLAQLLHPKPDSELVLLTKRRTSLSNFFRVLGEDRVQIAVARSR